MEYNVAVAAGTAAIAAAPPGLILGFFMVLLVDK